MKNCLYTLYDKKSCRYFENFFTAVNADDIKRIVIQSCSSNQFLTTFASDFDLYQVGFFDSDTGLLESKNKFLINLKLLFDEYKKGV